MTQRLKITVTILAAIFFMLAFILDITYFGQDWSIVWKSISITSILLILAIIIVTGLFLGFLLFRKKQYKQRILVTIPIAFILFSLADISKVAISFYGLDDEYNYFSARRDIKNGKVQILETGLILPTPNVDWDKQQAAEEIAANHFGYKTVYLGCTVTHGIDVYNSVMEDYLNEVNGDDWRVKQRLMFDSLMSSNKLK